MFNFGPICFSIFCAALNFRWPWLWVWFETRRHHKKNKGYIEWHYRHQHLISKSILTISMFSKHEKNKLWMNTLSYYSEQCADNLFCPSSCPTVVPHTTFTATCIYFSHVSHFVCCQMLISWSESCFSTFDQPVQGWQEVFFNSNLFYKQGWDVGALSCVLYKHMCLLHF